MSDTSQGSDWWIASDGKWYPPEQHPSYVQPQQTYSATSPAQPQQPFSQPPTYGGGYQVVTPPNRYAQPPTLQPSYGSKPGLNTSLPNWLVAGGGLVVLISSFIPFYTGGCSTSSLQNGFGCMKPSTTFGLLSGTYGSWRWLIPLIAILLLAVAGVVISGLLKNKDVEKATPFVFLGGSIVLALVVAAALLSHNPLGFGAVSFSGFSLSFGLGIGAWICLVGALACLVGGVIGFVKSRH